MRMILPVIDDSVHTKVRGAEVEFEVTDDLCFVTLHSDPVRSFSIPIGEWAGLVLVHGLILEGRGIKNLRGGV